MMNYAEMFNTYVEECRLYSKMIKDRCHSKYITLEEVNKEILKVAEMAEALNVMFRPHKIYGAYCTKDGRDKIKDAYMCLVIALDMLEFALIRFEDMGVCIDWNTFYSVEGRVR